MSQSPSFSSADEVAMLTAKLAKLVSSPSAPPSAPSHDSAGDILQINSNIKQQGGTCPQCHQKFATRSTLVAHFDEHTMFSTGELLELMQESAVVGIPNGEGASEDEGNSAGFRVKDRTLSGGAGRSDDDEEEELLMMLMHEGADSPQSNQKQVHGAWAQSDIQALMAELQEKKAKLSANASEIHEKDCLLRDKEAQLADMEQLVVELNQRIYSEQQASRSADERVARMGRELVEQRHAAATVSTVSEQLADIQSELQKSLQRESELKGIVHRERERRKQAELDLAGHAEAEMKTQAKYRQVVAKLKGQKKLLVAKLREIQAKEAQEAMEAKEVKEAGVKGAETQEANEVHDSASTAEYRRRKMNLREQLQVQIDALQAENEAIRRSLGTAGAAVGTDADADRARDAGAGAGAVPAATSTVYAERGDKNGQGSEGGDDEGQHKVKDGAAQALLKRRSGSDKDDGNERVLMEGYLTTSQGTLEEEQIERLLSFSDVTERVYCKLVRTRSHTKGRPMALIELYRSSKDARTANETSSSKGLLRLLRFEMLSKWSGRNLLLADVKHAFAVKAQGLPLPASPTVRSSTDNRSRSNSGSFADVQSALKNINSLIEKSMPKFTEFRFVASDAALRIFWIAAFEEAYAWTCDDGSIISDMCGTPPDQEDGLGQQKGQLQQLKGKQQRQPKQSTKDTASRPTLHKAKIGSGGEAGNSPGGGSSGTSDGTSSGDTNVTSVDVHSGDTNGGSTTVDVAVDVAVDAGGAEQWGLDPNEVTDLYLTDWLDVDFQQPVRQDHDDEGDGDGSGEGKGLASRGLNTIELPLYVVLLPLRLLQHPFWGSRPFGTAGDVVAGGRLAAGGGTVLEPPLVVDVARRLTYRDQHGMQRAFLQLDNSGGWIPELSKRNAAVHCVHPMTNAECEQHRRWQKQEADDELQRRKPVLYEVEFMDSNLGFELVSVMIPAAGVPAKKGGSLTEPFPAVGYPSGELLSGRRDAMREVVVVKTVKRGTEAALKGVLVGDIALSIAGEEIQAQPQTLAQAKSEVQAQQAADGGGMFPSEKRASQGVQPLGQSMTPGSGPLPRAMSLILRSCGRRPLLVDFQRLDAGQREHVQAQWAAGAYIRGAVGSMMGSVVGAANAAVASAAATATSAPNTITSRPQQQQQQPQQSPRYRPRPSGSYLRVEVHSAQALNVGTSKLPPGHGTKDSTAVTVSSNSGSDEQGMSELAKSMDAITNSLIKPMLSRGSSLASSVSSSVSSLVSPLEPYLRALLLQEHPHSADVSTLPVAGGGANPVWQGSGDNVLFLQLGPACQTKRAWIDKVDEGLSEVTLEIWARPRPVGATGSGSASGGYENEQLLGRYRFTTHELKGIAIRDPEKRWHALDKGGRVQCTISFVENESQSQKEGEPRALVEVDTKAAAPAANQGGDEAAKSKAEEFKRRKAAWKAKKKEEEEEEEKRNASSPGR
jgi:hypothetical protein